jgi:hypothetical protein
MDASKLNQLRERLAGDLHLVVLVTTRPGAADPQVAVVNAGVLDHPVDGRPVVGLVAHPGAKLVNLRAQPRATVVARAGWQWMAARGPVELSGPDDPGLGLDVERQRLLLRDIYHAAGGNHPDLDAYDRTMLDDRRCAVLITPEHLWSNPGS